MIPILAMPHRGPAGPHSMRVKGPRRTHRRADDRLTPHPRRAPLAVAVALALGTGGLEAATFKVTTNADSGAGSLRQAVLDANAAAGADEITFTEGLGEILLTSGQLDITETLTITGPASGQTIDGNQNGRILGVNQANTPLTLENLNLINGRTQGANSDCSSSGGEGGAICTLGGELVLTNSILSGNTSSLHGGGVHSQSGFESSTVILTNSTVSGNTVSSRGGGIYSLSDRGTNTVTLNSSILAGNVVGGTASTSGKATGGTANDCEMSSGSATANK